MLVRLHFFVANQNRHLGAPNRFSMTSVVIYPMALGKVVIDHTSRWTHSRHLFDAFHPLSALVLPHHESSSRGLRVGWRISGLEPESGEGTYCTLLKRISRSRRAANRWGCPQAPGELERHLIVLFERKTSYYHQKWVHVWLFIITICPEALSGAHPVRKRLQQEKCKCIKEI